MASVGSFGKVRVQEEPEETGAEPLTFEWFGVEIRLATQFSQIRLVNLMEAARHADVKDPMSLVIVKDMFRAIVDSGDFQSFWKLAEQEDQDLESLVAVFEVLFAAMTGRPIQRQSDSSTGLPEASTSSPDESTTQASRGRPDIQNLIQSGEESRERLMKAIGEV